MIAVNQEFLKFYSSQPLEIRRPFRIPYILGSISVLQIVFVIVLFFHQKQGIEAFTSISPVQVHNLLNQDVYLISITIASLGILGTGLVLWVWHLFLRNLETTWEKQKRILTIAQKELSQVNHELTDNNQHLIQEIIEREQVELALTKSQKELLEKTHQLEQTLKELQSTQSQLIQTEKMSSLGQMVAGIAHEINNPVSFIFGNLAHATTYTQDLLGLVNLYQKQTSDAPPEITQRIEEIELEYLQQDLPNLLQSMKVGTVRILNIVKSLRTFSRLDEAVLKEVDIHEGIDSTLMILNNRLKQKKSHPEVEVIKNYDHLPLIDCYPGQLNQVFMNILSNAIDAFEFQQDKGQDRAGRIPQIHIQTQKLSSNWVSIQIQDNGSGIPEDIQSKLFDPFFTTKPIGKGTGLGLSISYQIIVEKHGGKLYCNSTLGEGTEFVIEIPMQQIISPET